MTATMAGNKPGSMSKLLNARYETYEICLTKCVDFTEPKSKRTPVRLRHKIEKASSAKQKKARKAAKKNPEWRTRLKKDPGIPNLFPFKDKILAEIEESKRRKAEEAIRRRAEMKATKEKTGAQVEAEVEARMEGVEEEEIEALLEEMEEDGSEMDEDANPMAALLASAKARAAEYENGVETGDEMDEDDEESEDFDDEDGGVELSGMPTRKEGSRKAFDKVFKQVVDQADVVLYVLDARDPEGTRSKDVERMVMAAASGGKRLILILNKIDLIPPPVLKAWLIHLRRYFPTLPLRASGPCTECTHFQLQTINCSKYINNTIQSPEVFRSSETAQACNICWSNRLSKRRQVLSYQRADFSSWRRRCSLSYWCRSRRNHQSPRGQARQQIKAP